MRIVYLVLALLVPLTAFAQIGTPATSGELFTASITPQNPAPYSRVSLSFMSTSLDLTNSTLTLVVQGKKLYSGAVQPIAIPIGGAGSTTSIVATIVSNGTPYTQSLSIQPQDVILIAEPLSSAPALYPGKSLVPLEGSTRVVAVARLVDRNGQAINPRSLSYVWTVDDTKIVNSSGIGKQAIVVASPLQYRDRSVSVMVQDQGGTIVGTASINLSPEQPILRVYENDPLLGIRFEHALGEKYAIQKSESTIFAVPYSFTTLYGIPRIQWFLNSSSAQSGSSITLRPTGSGEGVANLSVTASTNDETQASAALSVLFGSRNTNIFGL